MCKNNFLINLNPLMFRLDKILSVQYFKHFTLNLLNYVSYTECIKKEKEKKDK